MVDFAKLVPRFRIQPTKIVADPKHYIDAVLRIRIRIGSGSSKGSLAVLKPTKVKKFCKFNQIMSKGLYLFQFLKKFITFFHALKPLGVISKKNLKKYCHDLEKFWVFTGIRIRIEIFTWIRIRIETYPDPQHCYLGHL